MIKLIKIGWGWMTGNRDYLTLLIVAGAAAWLYVQFATVRADRDRLLSLGQQLCVAAGSELQPEGAKTKDRGIACQSAIVRLANFERETNIQTAQILIDAMNARDAKQRADLASAHAEAEQARTAALEMEKANASIASDDRVGSDWFAALNRTAGLYPPAH